MTLDESYAAAQTAVREYGALIAATEAELQRHKGRQIAMAAVVGDNPAWLPTGVPPPAVGPGSGVVPGSVGILGAAGPVGVILTG